MSAPSPPAKAALGRLWRRPRLPAMLVLLAAAGSLTLAKATLVLDPPPDAAASAEVAVAAPETVPDPGPGNDDWSGWALPAAGPDGAEAGSDDDAAAGTGAAADPLARFDAARLTPSEIGVLANLDERRRTLEARERDLEMREALLDTAEVKLARQLEELQQLRAEVEAAIEAMDTEEAEKIARLVKIYETMKAKAAAEIFDRLEMPVLVRVVERMAEAKASDVIARMDPGRAEQLTSELAHRRQLLQLVP